MWWLESASLGARLSLVVALIVTLVVTAVAYLEMRSFERRIEHTLESAARLAAESAANSVVEHEALDPLDLRDSLHDLIDADPAIDAISVITAEQGQTRVLTSTSTEERADLLDLAVWAIQTGMPASRRGDTVVMFALPVPRRPTCAVAVTVGLESLLQARAEGLRLALGFTVPTIVLITILVHLTVRRLLGRPLAGILSTMQETADGNLSARTSVVRHDELGTIARGLNSMLDQLERSNRSLHERVDESLARAERVAALGQVAANVAHQAGTPLNLVSGYVQMILEDPRTDDRIRSRLRLVDGQIQQVTRALRTMLDRARHTPRSEVVRLPDVIEHVRELSAARLSRSNIRLRINVEEHVPPVKADPAELEMALLNLVTNALDAMPTGGRLSIAVSGQPEGVRIEVADTGPGIPNEVVEHLFDPWVTTKSAGQGTGLGLAIVREVVRAHAGTVSVRSQSSGAVFVIDLPAFTQPTAA